MKDTEKIYWKGIGAIISVIGIIIFFTLQQINIPQNEQWSNNATLIVEVGVGVVVTIVVLMISKISEKKSQEKIDLIKKWVSSDRINALQRQVNVYGDVAGWLVPLKLMLGHIVDSVKIYEKLNAETLKNVQMSVEANVYSSKISVEKLKDSEFIHLNYFSLQEKGFLDAIINETFTMDLMKPIDETKLVHVQGIFNKMDKAIDFTSMKRDTVREELTQIQMDNAHTNL